MTLSTRSVGNSVMTQNLFSCHGNVAVAQIDVDEVCLLKYLANRVNECEECVRRLVSVLRIADNVDLTLWV
jgi:hypothetical protein